MSAAENDPPLFPSFFVGGFECSSQRLRSGRQLDMAQSTRHVEFADADYDRLVDAGIRVARDGFAWHRVEPAPGRRDFSTVLPLVRAARRAGVRVIWDVMHFGWPEDLDIWTPAFVDRLAALARDFAKLLADEGDEVPWISPVNEVSFLSWAGGDVAALNPFAVNRGFELKCQLVRAAIAVIEAVRDVEPRTRIVVHDPAFNVVAPTDRPEDIGAAEASRVLQFQGCDLLSGRLWPQLGGQQDYLDVIGVNYYPWNQWTYGTALHPGEPIVQGDARYRPLGAILTEWRERYGRPTYIGETGCEGERRASWMRYVGDELAGLRATGVPIDGVCLYPIVDFPGWENERHCENGLWSYADDRGERSAHAPLAAELRRQQQRFAGDLDIPARPLADVLSLDEARADRDRWPVDPTLARIGNGGTSA